MFLQSSLETVFTPLSKRLLGFTSVENSVTYVAIGAVAVAGYLRHNGLYYSFISSRSFQYFNRGFSSLIAQYVNRVQTANFSGPEGAFGGHDYRTRQHVHFIYGYKCDLH